MPGNEGLAGLRRLSRSLGADKSLANGPGGNVSLKVDGLLWVKASGTWLVHADNRNIFVPLDLGEVWSRIAAGDIDGISTAIRSELAAPGARPSIETALHALMPQPVVAHIHAVNTAVHSILADGRARIAAALGSRLAWTWVGYHRPGAPLADAIGGALRRGTCDIVILQNHGLVVGGDSTESVLAIIREVEQRLALPERASVRMGQAECNSAEYEWLTGRDHLASSEISTVFGAATLFPDQAVFLGGPVPIVAAGEALDQAAERVKAQSGIGPTLLVSPRVGAFGRIDRSPAAESQIEWMNTVAGRVPAGASLSYLTQADLAELLDWDAEHYRRSLNAT